MTKTGYQEEPDTVMKWVSSSLLTHLRTALAAAMTPALVVMGSRTMYSS